MSFEEDGSSRKSCKAMIEVGIMKLGQVVLVYSRPSEEALMGVVDSIDYPIMTIETVQRDGKKKYKKFEQLDLSTIKLSVLTDDFIKEYFSPKEKKRLKKIQTESEVSDMFEGTY